MGPSPSAVLAHVLALACWACATLAQGAQAPAGGALPLPPELATALAKARVPRDAVALLVQPLQERAPARLAHRTEAPMNPASVMKMVTTLAALDQLGPQHHWNTRFYADGPLADGVLHGNLYIQGGGDPKLVLERVDAAFRLLQELGVRHVRGDMLLDGSIFDVPDHDPAAFDNEPLRPYNVAPDGLLVNFKALTLRFTPQADGTARIDSEPPLAGVAIPPSVALDASQPCGNWRGALQADFSNPDAVQLAGRYPARCGERDWVLAYVDPSSYARRALLGLFQAAGGRLDGQVRAGRPGAEARLLLAVPSLPLAEVIADVNKRSNNVMAQQLMLTLAAQRQQPGRMEQAREAILAWWQRFVGRDVPPPVVDNGSGLSRQERISARALAAMLRAASQHREAATYLQSLSLAGVDGTTERMRERGLRHVLGNAWLKTGSLRDVASVAGYVQGRSGQQYVVVGMVNHPNAGAARGVLDQLLEWAADDEH